MFAPACAPKNVRISPPVPAQFLSAAAHAMVVGTIKPTREPLKRKPEQAEHALGRIQLDTLVGMGFSNAVALAIMITTAATLHQSGGQPIETAAEAAQALRPIAGELAFALFALGIVGTGLNR
jgi:Mn2+/Fe2+ NRAMP family transporter